MLCHVAAVKSLPVYHHSAGYILFHLGSLCQSGYFENRIPLKPSLGLGRGAYAASQTTVLLMKRLNQTESPIVMIFCVLCFQRQSILTFILLKLR